MKYALGIILQILVLSVFAENETPPIRQLVESLDKLYRSTSSYTEMTMDIVTPHWERSMTMKAWSEGTDMTFIRILSPARDAGMATLRIGDEMWNYLPNTNSTVRVPPSMMSGSWMGSDITNNDIVREITYAEDYEYSYLPDSTVTDTSEEGIVYVELIPKNSTAVVWSRIVCSVRLRDMIPLRENYYDSSGDLIRTITFSQVEEMDGRTIPTVMTVVPEGEEGRRTRIEWTHAVFDSGVDEDIFTLRNLQSGGNP